MKIVDIHTIAGPNVYSHQPASVMKLYLEDLTGRESREVPGFIDRLLAVLPGCTGHYCALGRPGGFIERLRGGTYFGHVVEHVALELTDPVGISTYRGKTVNAGEPGRYLVAVTYKSEHAMKHLLRTAVELVQALADEGRIRWNLVLRKHEIWWRSLTLVRAPERSWTRQNGAEFRGTGQTTTALSDSAMANTAAM